MHISCVVGSVNRKSPVTVTLNGTLLLKNARTTTKLCQSVYNDLKNVSIRGALTVQVVKGRDIELSTNAKATILEPTIGQDLNQL